MDKSCETCTYKNSEGLNKKLICDKCVNFNFFDWSCNYCAFKSKELNKFCVLDSDDGSAACFRGDHFELINEL